MVIVFFTFLKTFRRNTWHFLERVCLNDWLISSLHFHSILLVRFRFVGLLSYPPWKYWQMTLLFSYPKRFHVFGGSSPTWIKTNFLLGLSQVFPWGSALESVRYDFGTFRMFLILYSFLLLDVYLCITFCGNPNVCKRIVHPLLISHLRHNYNLVNNLCSLNRCYEARHHLIVRLKTFECFKLLICAITCLQN